MLEAQHHFVTLLFWDYKGGSGEHSSGLLPKSGNGMHRKCPAGTHPSFWKLFLSIHLCSVNLWMPCHSRGGEETGRGGHVALLSGVSSTIAPPWPHVHIRNVWRNVKRSFRHASADIDRISEGTGANAELWLLRLQVHSSKNSQNQHSNLQLLNNQTNFKTFNSTFVTLHWKALKSPPRCCWSLEWSNEGGNNLDMKLMTRRRVWSSGVRPVLETCTGDQCWIPVLETSAAPPLPRGPELVRWGRSMETEHVVLTRLSARQTKTNSIPESCCSSLSRGDIHTHTQKKHTHSSFTWSHTTQTSQHGHTACGPPHWANWKDRLPGAVLTWSSHVKFLR